MLSYRKGYHKSPKCNKCGSGWNARLVPNSIFFMDIGDICCIHDDRYEKGKVIAYKEMADREFRNNLLRRINSMPWYYPKRMARAIAQGYYEAVVNFGGPAFWDGKGV